MVRFPTTLTLMARPLSLARLSRNHAHGYSSPSVDWGLLYPQVDNGLHLFNHDQQNDRAIRSARADLPPVHTLPAAGFVRSRLIELGDIVERTLSLGK